MLQLLPWVVVVVVVQMELIVHHPLVLVALVLLALALDLQVTRRMSMFDVPKLFGWLVFVFLGGVFWRRICVGVIFGGGACRCFFDLMGFSYSNSMFYIYISRSQKLGELIGQSAFLTRFIEPLNKKILECLTDLHTCSIAGVIPKPSK